MIHVNIIDTSFIKVTTCEKIPFEKLQYYNRDLDIHRKNMEITSNF